jgi:hypothetical protein
MIQRVCFRVHPGRVDFWTWTRWLSFTDRPAKGRFACGKASAHRLTYTQYFPVTGDG